MRFFTQIKTLLSFLVCFFLLSVIFVCLFCRSTYSKDIKFVEDEEITALKVSEYYDYFSNNFYYRCRANDIKKEVKKADSVDILFLGDDKYENLENDRYFRDYNTLNQGIKNDTTKGVYSRLEYAYKANPKVLVLQVGFNDLTRENREVEFIKVTYETIVKNIKNNLKDTTVILESVYPSSDENQYSSIILNEKIVALNEVIEEIANEYECVYSNTYELLLDEDNEIRYMYSSDGKEISDIGYAVIAKKLNEVIAANIK